MPKLTIGMAHYEDWEGVWSTVQALRLYHGDMSDVELIVVDNSPFARSGQQVKALIENHASHGLAAARYIDASDTSGTTQTRQRIFDKAQGDWVIVLDCHVFLVDGAIAKFREYIAEHPDSNDIISGPLWMDNLVAPITHFDDQLRDHMWGTWGLAWRSPDGEVAACYQDKGQTRWRTVEMNPQPVEGWPEIDWASHELYFKQQGYEFLSATHCPVEGPPEEDEPAFETPGMGLGLFAMRREAWPGFNPHCRGFGAEELCIHEKVRQHGGRSLCLPGFGWVHRFRDTTVPPPYAITTENKARNYILWATELGLDVERFRSHFVDRVGVEDTNAGPFDQAHWDSIIEDPERYEPTILSTGDDGCTSCGDASWDGSPLALPEDDSSIEQLFVWGRDEAKRDAERHFDWLAGIASRVNDIVDFSKRRESILPLLEGLRRKHGFDKKTKLKRLRCYTSEPDALYRFAHAAVDAATDVGNPEALKLEFKVSGAIEPHSVDFINETDLIYLNAPELSADYLWGFLAKFGHRSRRYIILHGTQSYGETGESRGEPVPGMRHAMRRYMQEHPEWSVLEHRVDQYGMTLLGRLPEDKPKLPSTITMAANLAKSMANYVADGMQNATKDVVGQRLEMCSICDQRVDTRCAACGCYLDKKSSIASDVCPLGRWEV